MCFVLEASSQRPFCNAKRTLGASYLPWRLTSASIFWALAPCSSR